jgi:hypothetical protein
MVAVTINGKKSIREFQNMAQALGFAARNGECINAEKVELAYAAKKPARKETGGGSTGNTPSPSGGVSETQSAGAPGTEGGLREPVAVPGENGVPGPGATAAAEEPKGAGGGKTRPGGRTGA